MTLRDDYARWSGHDYPEQVQAVQGLSFFISNPDGLTYGGAYYIGDYGQQFYAFADHPLAGRSVQLFAPIPFKIDGITVAADTSQTATVTLSGLSGPLYRQILKPMTLAQRNFPIEVRHYVYLDNNFSAPVFDPATVYYLEAVDVTVTDLVLSLSNQFLPNKRAGTAYTPRQFPTLYYV